MASIHDSLLVGYTVNGLKRTIVFVTEPNRGSGGAFEIRFSGVTAYHVEGDTLQNIVGEVLEVPLEGVLVDETRLLERHRRSGWPSGWNPVRESAQEFFKRQSGRMFELNCSYGLGAWVFAEQLEVVPRTNEGVGGQQGAAADGASPRC